MGYGLGPETVADVEDGTSYGDLRAHSPVLLTATMVIFVVICQKPWSLRL